MRSCGRNRGNLLAADGQAFAAFRATALQHQAPVFRAHAHQEAVSFGAMAIIRLKRALTLHWSPIKDEPAMLPNGFRECQSKWRWFPVSVDHRWANVRASRVVRPSACAETDGARFSNGPGIGLCYSLRPSGHSRSASNTCEFGLFPKFSTPVEKTVENRENLPNHAGKRAAASGSRQGEGTPKPVSVMK